VGGLPSGLGQKIVVVEQGHGMVRGFSCRRGGFKVTPVCIEKRQGGAGPACLQRAFAVIRSKFHKIRPFD
jgi:hypothetical protein